MSLLLHFVKMLTPINSTYHVFPKFLIFIISIIIYSVIYTYYFRLEDFFDTSLDIDKAKEDESNLTYKYLQMFYFSAITQSTVGFGDIYPRSVYSKIVVVLQILSSYILLSL